MINVFGYKTSEEDSESLYNITKFLDKIEEPNLNKNLNFDLFNEL